MRTIKAIFVTSLVLLFGISVNVHALTIEEIPFEFEDYDVTTLDWVDSADGGFTGSTALGFSVTIGGAAYSYFDMSSDGYIELLTDAGDVPTSYGYGSVVGLLYNVDFGADPTSTYLFAAYDDLSSAFNGYYGCKLFSDRAVFYYDTETWQDEDLGLLNNFEVVLYDDGNVQWNFNYAEYDAFDFDLFSGLYLGNTQTLLGLTGYDIPEQRSYITTPEPATILLLGLGAVMLRRKR
ncbi:MAG: PEP-CTERM sorting domain-containing protein [Planctomycetota bacterium]